MMFSQTFSHSALDRGQTQVATSTLEEIGLKYKVDLMMAPDKDTQEILELQKHMHHASCKGKIKVINSILSGKSDEVIRQILNEPYLGTLPLVVAAHRGRMHVVKYLVKHFSVDLDLEGMPRDGSKKRACAVICAALRSDWKMVRFLVDKGCDINVHSPSGETLLWYACDHNNLQMVQYLVEKGAKIQGVNEQGQTCLMDACVDGHRKIVKYLLENGADPNEKDDEGKTALHFCAEEGDHEIVQLLLEHGAAITKDNEGFTPVMLGALHKDARVVDTFLTSPNVSPQDRIDGLEVLAALSRVDMPRTSFTFLYRAMRERYQGPYNFIAKPFSPLPTLTGVAESQTIQELSDRCKDREILRLECLAILLRIIGPLSRSVHDAFREEFYILLGECSSHKDVAVLLHCLKVYNNEGPFLRREFELIRDAFEMLIEQGLLPLFEHIQETLGLMLKEMKRRKNSLNPDDETETSYFVLGCLNYIWLALTVAKDDEKKHLQKLVESLIHLNISLPRGRSLLHVAAGPFKFQVDEDFAHSMHLSYETLVHVLIECGADVNAVNQYGDRPLHIAAILAEEEDDSGLACAFIRILLEAGALVGVQNRAGETPLDCARTKAVADILREHYPPTLKTLAAIATLQHNLPYAAQLPEIVADFVRLHSPKKK